MTLDDSYADAVSPTPSPTPSPLESPVRASRGTDRGGEPGNKRRNGWRSGQALSRQTVVASATAAVVCGAAVGVLFGAPGIAVVPFTERGQYSPEETLDEVADMVEKVAVITASAEGDIETEHVDAALVSAEAQRDVTVTYSVEGHELHVCVRDGSRWLGRTVTVSPRNSQSVMGHGDRCHYPTLSAGPLFSV